MKFAIEGHNTEDWEGPPTLQTGYVYADQAAAERDASRWMRAQIAAGIPCGWVGAYLISEERDDWDNPIVEHCLTIWPNGRCMNNDENPPREIR